MRRNLLSTDCPCGYKLGEREITPPIEPCKRQHFYGGAVDGFCDAVCPECGKKYKLYLKVTGHGLTVFDMEPSEETEERAKATKKAATKKAATKKA